MVLRASLSLTESLDRSMFVHSFPAPVDSDKREREYKYSFIIIPPSLSAVVARTCSQT